MSSLEIAGGAGDHPMRRILRITGRSTDVSVVAAGAIPRSTGKAVRVRDLRPKDTAGTPAAQGVPRGG